MVVRYYVYTTKELKQTVRDLRKRCGFKKLLSTRWFVRLKDESGTIYEIRTIY